MRSIIAALAVGLAGLSSSGCVDESSYTGPTRYPAERDYRRYESYDRYDGPRYRRYDPPRYESYDPYDRYPRYERSDYRRPSYDRRDDDRWNRERERAERRREDDQRREEQWRNRQLDERNRELDRRNRDLDERNREIARRERERSDAVNDNRSEGPRPYRPPGATSTRVLNQKSGLTEACVGQGADQKCQWQINRPPR